MSGLIVIAGFTLMAIIGPYLYPENLPIDPDAIYAAPSLAHPLGTDFEGTDVLALIVTGSRYMLLSAVIAGAVMIILGTAAGVAAGYFRGPPDCLIMRMTDLVLTIPGFPLLLVLSTVWDFGSPCAMGLVLGIFGWGGLARAVRAQTLVAGPSTASWRRRAAWACPAGASSCTRCVPNVAPYIAMNLLLSVTGAIYAEVGLFFLGVVPFSAGNWGVMLNIAVFSAGAVTSPQALTYLLAPLLCILLLTLGIVLVLDAADEWFNPRLRAARMTRAAQAGRCAPGVRMRDLTVAFATAQGEMPAVSHVSLDLAPGQITGLVGESGSGKSTLALAVLNAVPAPGRVTSGAVEIDGIGNVLALPAARLRQVRGAEIGYVFQAAQNSLNPLKPVGKQLLDLGRSHGDG